ncbi:MAM and LDL-receptor class A domain-containing protein 1-like [Mytilus trossulus]|uniref:MAM and LDL-receptor class A domain-containing protein 1-like n=1 Tax=Mytilus trossulus TaxID=6551 RepID=UPI0030063C89
MAVNYKKSSRTYENEKFDRNVAGVEDEDDDQADYEEIAEYADKPPETKKIENKYTDWNERGAKNRNERSKKSLGNNKNENTKNVSLKLPTKQKLVDVKVVKRIWRTACAISAVVCVVLLLAVGVLLGLLLSTKASPCAYVHCFHNGNCSVSGDKAICNCHDGFYGSKCEDTPCGSYSCYNGGTCFIDQLKPKCACKEGFTGDHCTTTPCSRSPCEHGGTCSVKGSGFSCACENGFTGLQCESTPCVSYSCHNGGTCLLDNLQPNCTCNIGFSGVHCEIYVADFETSFDSMFIQDQNDDFNWLVHSGKTSSSNTGPLEAYKGVHYLYFETSNGNEGSIARLVSRGFIFDSPGCLKFHYNMNGATIGALNVYQGNRRIWRKTGNQGNHWQLAELVLQANSCNCSKIYFEAVHGTSHTGDIAIDNVEVHLSRC